ncbi:MAG: hypothetical protein LBL45_01985 [Treponema sp.]|nr:hypothetical protein [Treponema sp.]
MSEPAIAFLSTNLAGIPLLYLRSSPFLHAPASFIETAANARVFSIDPPPPPLAMGN